MSLLLNMLSSLIITFLPKSKHLLISCYQAPPSMGFSRQEYCSGVPSHTNIKFIMRSYIGPQKSCLLTQSFTRFSVGQMFCPHLLINDRSPVTLHSWAPLTTAPSSWHYALQFRDEEVEVPSNHVKQSQAWVLSHRVLHIDRLASWAKRLPQGFVISGVHRKCTKYHMMIWNITGVLSINKWLNK